MTYTDVVKSIPGLTHYYPLDSTSQAKDVAGTLHGTNYGATFTNTGAVFDGTDYIELPISQDFSATKTGSLSILLFLTISDWRGAGATEYVHWAGKGEYGKHEFTFRHYIKGGTGQASTRQGRMSFYAFNAVGGLGAGSYYQDSTFPTTERVIVATLDRTYTTLYVNGLQRAKDPLSAYNIKQTYTTAPVRLGTREKTTGFLKGNIRRVAFFNRVLAPTEATKLYTERNQGYHGSVVTIGTASIPADFNVQRLADKLVVYTSAYGTSTRTNQWGTEVVVRNSKVVSVHDAVGNTPIPTDGYVLSGHGAARSWLKANAKVGATVTL